MGKFRPAPVAEFTKFAIGSGLLATSLVSSDGLVWPGACPELRLRGAPGEAARSVSLLSTVTSSRPWKGAAPFHLGLSETGARRDDDLDSSSCCVSCFSRVPAGRKGRGTVTEPLWESDNADSASSPSKAPSTWCTELAMTLSLSFRPCLNCSFLGVEVLPGERPDTTLDKVLSQFEALLTSGSVMDLVFPVSVVDSLSTSCPPFVPPLSSSAFTRGSRRASAS
mmetsp:Transcript_49968/g.119241  ORF Transcript_49968/g.119241 Transcript_49968/m.119241 type:complete len:224 (+) Transcript_49968:355-1026(+)